METEDAQMHSGFSISKMRPRLSSLYKDFVRPEPQNPAQNHLGTRQRARFRWYKTPDGKPLNAFGYEAWPCVAPHVGSWSSDHACSLHLQSYLLRSYDWRPNGFGMPLGVGPFSNRRSIQWLRTGMTGGTGRSQWRCRPHRWRTHHTLAPTCRA